MKASEGGATLVSFYAFTRDDPEDAAAQRLRKESDNSCLLPASIGPLQHSPSIVIGSLDISIGESRLSRCL